VHLFGSTATRLNLRSSNDLDISLDRPSALDKVPPCKSAWLCLKGVCGLVSVLKGFAG
jgi:hypothetical protein